MYGVVVVGTRPQIIKTAPVLREAERRGLRLDVVHTGQHYDYEMSRVFFNELNLPDPALNLGVGSGSHGWQTGEMIQGLEKAYMDLAPDMVVVPGDTNSTLAGALAAVKLGLPVAHLEAGCRSRDMAMPEEVNRRLTDHCSTLLFAVSRKAMVNLTAEGLKDENIALVGDTMHEAMQHHHGHVDSDPVLETLGVRERFKLVTVHRAENTDNPARLRDIFQAVAGHRGLTIFPCHPRTRKRLTEAGLMDTVQGSVKLIDPVGYHAMLKLVKEADAVLTDSGGLQKEALWLGTPCITLRDSTEWTETIDLGANQLVGADPTKIKAALESTRKKQARPRHNPYDFGGASPKIIARLKEYASKNRPHP